MKIALLSRYQSTSARGVESVVYELAKRLSKSHQVEILCGRDSDSFKKMISGNYDVVMPTNGRLQSLKASVGRFYSGYKLVIGGHSGIGRDDIFNLAFCKPDLFIALTDYMTSWAKNWAWGSTVIKINNGVDLKKFNPKGKKIDFKLPRPILLSVGALTWYKHHERTIDAVSRLRDSSLVIVGEGPVREKLQRLGKEKLGGRFKIMKVPYEKMAEAYRGADLFCLLPWDRESFGVVYLEAMASGLAVVAPDDLARKEIIGSGGILVNPKDSLEVANAIKNGLKKDWEKLPREQAEKFNWDKIAALYEDAFNKLIKR